MCIGNHSSFGHPEPSNALVARDDGWRPQRKMLITIPLWYIWYTIRHDHPTQAQESAEETVWLFIGYLLLVGGIPTLLKKYESQSGWLFPTYRKNVPNHQPDWLFIGYWYRICFSILCIVVPLNPNGPPLGIPRSYLQWDPLRWLGAPNFPASAANARAGMVASKPIGTAGDLPSSNWTGLTGFVIHIITKNWHETSNENETISAISQTSKMYQKVIGCISFMPRYCWYSWMPMAQVYPPFPTLQSLESWYLYIYICRYNIK